MLRLLRAWYTNFWHIGDRWINVRDKIIHLLLMAALSYNSFTLLDFLDLINLNPTNSRLVLVAFLFNAALVKEIFDYFTKTGGLHVGVTTRAQIDAIQIDILWDVAFDLAGMVIGWSLFFKSHSFFEYHSDYYTGVGLILLLTLALQFNRIHFKPDGSQALWGSKLYHLDDFPIYGGIVEDRDALLDEWTLERMKVFEDRLSEAKLGEEYDDEEDA